MSGLDVQCIQKYYKDCFICSKKGIEEWACLADHVVNDLDAYSIEICLLVLPMKEMFQIVSDDLRDVQCLVYRMLSRLSGQLAMMITYLFGT